MRDILSSPVYQSSEGQQGSHNISHSGVLSEPAGSAHLGIKNFGVTGSIVCTSGTDANSSNNFGGTSAPNHFGGSSQVNVDASLVDPEVFSLLSARLSKLEQKDGCRGAVGAVYFGDHFFGSEQNSLAFLEKHLGGSQL